MSRKNEPAPKDALRRKGPGKYAPGDSPAKASLRRGRAGGSSRHVVKEFDFVQDVIRRAGSHPWEMLPGFGEGAVAGEVSKQAQAGRPGVAAGLALAAALPVVGAPLSKKLARELAKKGGRISASAIKLPNGKVLEGTSHFDAMERGGVSNSPMLKKAVSGYVDQAGNFLTLDEAGQRMKHLGLAGDAWKNARSEEIVHAQKGYAPKFEKAKTPPKVAADSLLPSMAIPLNPATRHTRGLTPQSDRDRAAVLLKKLREDGGFTLDANDNPVTTGFAVGAGKLPGANLLQKPLDKLTVDDIANYLAKHPKDQLKGGWVDNGMVYIEPSTHVTDKAEAVKLGRKRKELAVGDLAAYARGDFDAGTVKLPQTRYKVDKSPAGTQIKAMGEDGTHVGSLFLEPDGTPIMVNVAPEHRRQGIASGLYDEAERALGKPITPSGNLTKDAEAFWGARQKKQGATMVGGFSQEPGDVMGAKFDTPNGPISVRFTYDPYRGTPLDVKTISTPEQGVINDKTPGANTRGVAAVRAVFKKLKEITGADEVTGTRVSGANKGKKVDRALGDTLFHGTFKNFDEFKLSDKDIGVHLGTPAQAHARLSATVNDPRIFIEAAKGDHPQMLKVATPYKNGVVPNKGDLATGYRGIITPRSRPIADPRVLELPDLGQWKIKDLQDEITKAFDDGWEVQNMHTHAEIRDWLKAQKDKHAVTYQNHFEAPEDAAHSLAVLDPKEAKIIASMDMSAAAQDRRMHRAAALRAKGASPKDMAAELADEWRPRGDSVAVRAASLTAEEVARERKGTHLRVKNGRITEVPNKIKSASAVLPFADKDFAATRLPDGRVFRGEDHRAARSRAVYAAEANGQAQPDNYVDGFVLKDGSFVTRAKGAELFAKARNDFKTASGVYPLVSEDFDIAKAKRQGKVAGDSVVAKVTGGIPEQKDLPRMLPKKKPQALLDEVEERTLRAYMGPKFEKWAAEGNFGNWYDTFGTEQAARDALGDEEGPAAFKRLMQFMGATTARSTPANNLRRAGYYRGLENAGLLDVEALFNKGYKKVPEGMGHIANNAHHNALASLLEGGLDPIKNPKPASFTENLSRNQRPFTNDTRMATGLRHVDPTLEKMGAFTKSTNPHGGVTFNPRDWAYGPMERAGQRAASEYAGRGMLNVRPGLDPTAHFQAKVWDALGAEIPGSSRSAGLFDDVFKSKLDENAKRWGLKPSEANKLFWQGHPFDLPLNKDVVPRGLLSMFR
jgi:hypothetical protein